MMRVVYLCTLINGLQRATRSPELVQTPTAYFSRELAPEEEQQPLSQLQIHEGHQGSKVSAVEAVQRGIATQMAQLEAKHQAEAQALQQEHDAELQPLLAKVDFYDAQ